MKRKLAILGMVALALIAMGAWEGPIQLKRGNGPPTYLLPGESGWDMSNEVFYIGISPSNPVAIAGGAWASTNYVATNFTLLIVFHGGTNAVYQYAVGVSNYTVGVSNSLVLFTEGATNALRIWTTNAIRGATNDLWTASTNAFQKRFFRIETTATNYQISDLNDIIMANGASNINVTLPSAVGVTGRVYTVKNVSTYKVNVVTAGGSIDGTATNVIVSKWDCFEFFCDGANWFKK